jgi:hypothetical protein
MLAGRRDSPGHMLTARDDVMIVWLWDAGSAHGVSDDDARAREVAETLIRDGRASSARVEMAVLNSVRALDPDYGRLGCGWTAQRHRSGAVRWVALTGEPVPRGDAAREGEQQMRRVRSGT